MSDEEVNISYQDAFEKQVAKIPEVVFRSIISQKIDQQGIKLTDAVFNELIAYLMQGGKGSFSIPAE